VLFPYHPKKVQDMMSDHIDNRKLYEVVSRDAMLERAEVEHLEICDECLEMIRVFVRQRQPKDANPH
jgi:hypothetical protein